MTGRRVHSRFKFSTRCTGHLRVLHDVVLLRKGEDGQLTAISNKAAVVGERLRLDVGGHEGDADLRVRVLDARPAVVDDAIRHELRLEVLKPTGGEQQFGVLTRETPVLLINLSHSGCLLESAHRVPTNLTGTLQMNIEGQDFVEHVEVVRCQHIEGAGDRYHVGVRFVWTASERRRSLSSVVAPSPQQMPAWLVADELRDVAR